MYILAPNKNIIIYQHDLKKKTPIPPTKKNAGEKKTEDAARCMVITKVQHHSKAFAQGKIAQRNSRISGWWLNLPTHLKNLRKSKLEIFPI